MQIEETTMQEKLGTLLLRAWQNFGMWVKCVRILQTKNVCTWDTSVQATVAWSKVERGKDV